MRAHVTFDMASAVGVAGGSCCVGLRECVRVLEVRVRCIRALTCYNSFNYTTSSSYRRVCCWNCCGGTPDDDDQPGMLTLGCW